MEPAVQATNLPQKRRRWSWWGRIWRLVVLLVVLAIIFYRPILFGLVRLGANFAEKSAGLRIEYSVSGSIFTNLEIKDLRILPTAPGPVKKITLQRAALVYHPLNYFKTGALDVLESVLVKDLLVNLDLSKPTPPKPKKERSAGFTLPPLPRQVEITGVKIDLTLPDSEVHVADFNLTLLPSRAGVLSIDQLTLPNRPPLENLVATTHYDQRDLILEGLHLPENLLLDRLEVDASQAAQKKLALKLAATAFGGSLAADLGLSDLGGQNNLALTAGLQRISLPEVGKLAAPTAKLSGSLDGFALKLNGSLANLATLSGSLESHLTAPGFGDFAFTEGNLRAQLQAGHVNLENIRFAKGEQAVALTGTLQLPGQGPAATPFQADVKFQIAAPQIAVLAPAVFTGGSLNVNGTVSATPKRLQAELHFAGPDLTLKQGQISALQGTVSLTKDNLDEKNVPWWKGTQSNVDFSVGSLVFSGYQIDQAKGNVTSVAEQMKIGPLDIRKGTNLIQTTGTMVFSGEAKPTFPGTLDLAIKIDAPLLREMAVDPVHPIIEGALAGNVSLHMVSPKPEAKVHLEGSGLSHQGVNLGTLALDAAMQDQIAQLTSLLLTMPNNGFVQATGSYDTRPDGLYAAQLSTSLPDLSYFKPLLGAALAEKPLTGTLQVDYSGTGNIATRQHQGQVSLYLKDGRFDQVQEIALQTQGYFTPKEAHFYEFKLHTDKGELSTVIDYANRNFALKELNLTQRGEPRLAGEVNLPLDLEKAANPQQIIPADGQLAINLTGKDLDLGKLQSDLGLTPQVTGVINLRLAAQGTIDNPEVGLEFSAAGLKSDKAAQFDPADINLALRLADKQAELTGTIKQPLLQPLTIQGKVPFDAHALRASGKPNLDAPVDLTVKLPASSLAKLGKFVPAIGTSDGTVALDVAVAGTLAQPKFSGGLQAKIQTLRFRDNSLPIIRTLDAAFGFRENILHLDKLSGNLAGGPFSGSGTVNLTNPKEPVLDIKLGGKSILFVRNDNVIVRSDLDLALRGPLATAELSGLISLTDSRFFREIDILPINLPGRPAPSLPSAPKAPSITSAPLRDWKFNVKIVTKDDFLIRGNLANGDIKVNLTLGGTGLAPYLEGNVGIYNMLASLPFSRLKIDYGNLYFGRELSPLSPVLDIRGSSRVRDYLIDVYIWGDATKPQTLFLSQPPLSQGDILTLIATGVTQTEIAQNPQLLAGRAGVLVLQKYYNKIFRRKGAAAASESDSPLKDVDIEIGSLDPKTGRQSATARMTLSDQWQVIANLDVTGGVEGQLRYLIHFK